MNEKDKKDLDEFKDFCKVCKGHKHYRRGGAPCAGGAMYGMGVIGALVYFVGQATSFWAGFLGIFQAFFWPAFIVYEALKLLVK